MQNDHQDVLRPSSDFPDCFLIYGGYVLVLCLQMTGIRGRCWPWNGNCTVLYTVYKRILSKWRNWKKRALKQLKKRKIAINAFSSFLCAAEFNNLRKCFLLILISKILANKLLINKITPIKVIRLISWLNIKLITSLNEL